MRLHTQQSPLGRQNFASIPLLRNPKHTLRRQSKGSLPHTSSRFFQGKVNAWPSWGKQQIEEPPIQEPGKMGY
jgi:hypothetical protein